MSPTLTIQLPHSLKGVWNLFFLQNKNKRYMTEIVASDLIMLGGSSKKAIKGDETAKDDLDLEEIQVDER